MTHDQAFKLVQEICPDQAGMLWDTTEHTGCDTAWAVADQFGDDPLDVNDAKAALRLLAHGQVPSDWQPHESE